MSSNLEKVLARRNEKLQKKKEKEEERKKKKLEKQRAIRKEKRKQKSIKRKLNYDRKRHKKEREKRIKKMERTGDEYGIFSIHLFKNGKRIQKFGLRRILSRAKTMFYKLLENNNKSVLVPRITSRVSCYWQPVKYELVLIKNVDGVTETNESCLPDDNGIFSDIKPKDTDKRKIILKEEWFVEDKFALFGYDPNDDRKTCPYLIERLLKIPKRISVPIYIYKEKLIFLYPDDMDIVVCSSIYQSDLLYKKLQKKLGGVRHKNMVFMGTPSRFNLTWIIDKMREKTGWSRYTCIRTSRLNKKFLPKEKDICNVLSLEVEKKG